MIIGVTGVDKIVAVRMDGACRSSFPLIGMKYPHVQCFICPTHSLDNFLKNVCSDKEVIKVASVKNSEDERDFKWDSDVFSNCIEHTWKAIKFITNHLKPLAVFRSLATSKETWVDELQPSALELLKYAETRFASKVLMVERYQSLRSVMELLVGYPEYKAWLSKQKSEKKAVGAEIKDIINSEDHWKAVELTTRVLTPVLRLLRFTDGKTGATLGKVYDQMTTVAATFDKPIEGLDDTTRERMWELFMARWTYFHEPVFTAAWFLDPEFLDPEFIRGQALGQKRKSFVRSCGRSPVQTTVSLVTVRC